uniref:protein CROWDED NUCLEI 2 n=1 Tax=Erigeron canadensis TaxID=72917 RepID=UPI001CB94ED6|nr:protein CROWDED NUCLEI 2 [Erigeron canadensis]
MSTCSSSGSSCFLDDEELLQFEARCKELRIEKDMIKESSGELLRSLESHAKLMSETRSNDKKRIQNLERELSNCSQEIDYLQDQVNTKDTLINHMTDYISNLESKLRANEDLDEIVRRLQQELKAQNSENLALKVNLENKEHELHDATLCIKELEESISNVTLDFQCDIESMKLDLMAMEHSFFEAKKVQEEVDQEHRVMQELTKNCKIQLQAARSVKHLVKENKALREKLKTFETNADSENQNKKLSCQIHEYELLVNQLKEQLKDEKFKAKEEAEDLAQEMAELRYQLTGLLEEEYKKRARMEQRALQRITELEAQIEKERRKTFADVRGLPSA